MSVVHIDGHLVHYEVLGRGRPMICLHSWLGTWRGWLPIMEALADRYRPLALDFWGFGDSAPPHDAITINRYVDQLNGFVDTLGIVAPLLVGHGLGGIVAVRAASQQPERFGKVVITGTPVLGSALTQVASPTGLGRLFGRAAAGNDLWLKLVRQAAGTANQPAMFAELLEDIAATDPAVMHAVLQALTDFDLAVDLAQLEQPLLAIYGGRDTIVPPATDTVIEDGPGRFRQLLRFEQSGHFPFLDQPNLFIRALLQFFSDSGQVVELKAEWRRRVSQREFL